MAETSFRSDFKLKKRNKKSSPKTPSKPPLPPPPLPLKPPGAPTMPPQGRESYPYPIFNSIFLNWSRGTQWIYCQKCRRKIIKDKYFTHNCEIKPSGPRAQRSIISSSLRGVKMRKLRKFSSRRAQSEKKSKSESDSQLVRKIRPITTAGAKIDPQLKGEVQSFIEWIKDSEGLSGYIDYYLQQNNTPIISELSKIYANLRKIFGV